MLRWLWNGVLAFDRIGRRIPQLIQMMLVEFGIFMLIGAFIAKWLDIRGGYSCPGEPGELDSTFWGALAIGLLCLFFFLRNVFRPRLVEGEWTPMVNTGIGAGGIDLVVGNRMWTVRYNYLTNHPSYVLILLPVLWVPLAMILFTDGFGCTYFYNRMLGWSAIWIAAGLAAARLISWYVLRLGRKALAHKGDSRVSSARAEWEIAWKPVLMLVVMMHAIVFVPVGIMFWNEQRTLDALPVATSADIGIEGEFRRINGRIKGEPVLWVIDGGGRGGNNYAGAGLLIEMDDGGEALLLAGYSAVPDLLAFTKEGSDGRISMLGRLMGTSIPENLQKYAAMTEADFAPPPSSGRLLIEVGQYPP